jgi:hypothetical protein
MVRRRCNVVVVSDASCDSDYSFESLANAIRKVRIDLGIPIELTTKLRFVRASADDEDPLYYWRDRRNSVRCGGPNAKPGILVYIKPALTGVESADVLNYSRSSPTFPPNRPQTSGSAKHSSKATESWGSCASSRFARHAKLDPVELPDFRRTRPMRHCAVADVVMQAGVAPKAHHQYADDSPISAFHAAGDRRRSERNRGAPGFMTRTRSYTSVAQPTCGLGCCK